MNEPRPSIRPRERWWEPRSWVSADPLLRPAAFTRDLTVASVAALYLVAGVPLVAAVVLAGGRAPLVATLGAAMLLSAGLPLWRLRERREDEAARVLCIVIALVPLLVAPWVGASVFVTPWNALPAFVAGLTLGPRWAAGTATASGALAVGGGALSHRGLLAWQALAPAEVLEVTSHVVALGVLAGVTAVHHSAMRQSVDLLERARDRTREAVSARAAQQGELDTLRGRLSELVPLEVVNEGLRATLHDVRNAMSAATAVPGFIEEHLERASVGRALSRIRELHDTVPPGRPQELATEVESTLWSLSEVVHGVGRENRLLDDVLGHAVEVLRSTRGEAAEQPRVCVDLAEVVAEVLRLRAVQLDVEDIELRRELEPAAARIQLHRFLRAFLNFLKNAEESVLTARAAGRWIVVRTRLDHEQAILEVEDNGTGLPEATARLLDRGYSTKGQGRGHGLANAQAAAMHMGGRLEWSSKGPGKGALFRLVLPGAPLDERS